MDPLKDKAFGGTDLFKVYLFASSDRFSFSHIDSLVRAVAQKMFTMLLPPGVPANVDKTLPILNYGNKVELKDMIEKGEVDIKNVYNNPDNLVNANSKVEFHKKTEGLPFVPKTVFTKEEAIANLKFPVIAKTDQGSKGEGVVVCKTPEKLKQLKDYQVFSEKYDLKKEYRCISIKGKVVFIAERVPENKKANSLREGKDLFDRTGTLDKRSSYRWDTVKMGEDGLPSREKFEEICSKVNDALGLEFLGVDVGLTGSGELFCIEANTCPGLNKDQVVIIYEAIFEDFFKRKPNATTQKTLDSFRDELMRANADPAKFSFSPTMGRKFYYFDDFKDSEGESKGRSVLTAKYDIEKSMGSTLYSMKHKVKENRIMSFETFINENNSDDFNADAQNFLDVMSAIESAMMGGIHGDKKIETVSVDPSKKGQDTKLDLTDIEFSEKKGTVTGPEVIIQYTDNFDTEKAFTFEFDLTYKVKRAPWPAQDEEPEQDEVTVTDIEVGEISLHEGMKELVLNMSPELEDAIKKFVASGLANNVTVE